MRTGRIAAIAAVVIGVVLAGWLFHGRGTALSAAAAPPDPAIPVTAGTAKAQDVPVYVQGIGTVQAINTVNVKTRVDGQIMQAFFTQGQEVQQNAPLFLIDPRPFQAALDQAKADAAKDTAQLQGAQRDLARYGKLVGTGFQTRQSFEDQQATVGQLQGAVQADNAAIEAAQLNLGFSMIRAPIGGRTGALLIDPGNYVQGSAATPLVSITQMKPIFVSFTLPATNLDAIRQSQAAQPLDVDAYGADGKALLGKGALSFIDNHVDTTTGTIALKGTFANTDERLWPGEFVNTRLILAVRHNAVTVPAATVMTGPNGDYVYVIGPGDMAQRRDVQLASRQDGLAVIAKGLTAGEQVVVGGQYRLANNVKVKIETARAAAADARQAG
jgi:membrane fusion protein, multidrug efflux system